MSEQREPEGNPIAVVGGLVLGVLLAWVVTAIAVIISYSAWGESDGGAAMWVVTALALLAGPVVGLVALKSAQVRSWLLIGFALGTIVGSGVCSLTFLGG